MPQMIATSEIEYPPGKHWKPGDHFEVEDAHAKLLEKLGRAKFPDERPIGDAAVTPQLAEIAPRRGPGRPPKAR
jgi:hypothetical protein